jgi:hypothetical protein
MKDPKLPPEQFRTDRITHSRGIASLADIAVLDGAYTSGNAVGFASRNRLILTLHPLPTDLPNFNSLTVRVFNDSHAPVLAGIKLVHGSESREPGLPDVSFSGGRELVLPGEWNHLRFPRESFGFYGTPRGWTDVRALELTFTWEKTHTGPDEIRVFMGQVDGERREIPSGPRLTAEGLASVLVQDVPGVTRFFAKSQVRSSDLADLDRVFHSLYTVDDPARLIPPPHPFPRGGAEAILSGSIMGQRLPEPIAWDANPLEAHEWTHFLNRHHFMRELIQALAGTGDERFARALDRMVAHWIEATPVPVNSNGGAGPAWETLSAAWRLREWLWIVGTAWPHPSFSAGTKFSMLTSVWEHARHLMDHQGHPNNWIIVESAALALAGLCFPQFMEAAQWADIGLERLGSEIRRQFFADGAHFEVSPLYHAICLHSLIEVKRVAAAAERTLPQEFDAPVEKSAEFLASLCRPDFSWPSLNDSGGACGDHGALTYLAGETYRRDDLVWIGSRGDRGSRPDWTSRVFPDSGIAVMRSHYGEDGNFLVFRAGPPGASHVHGDALSLDVTALGRPRLVDPGITAYAPSPLTDYYRSASAHNMILIDNRGPQRAGLDFAERTRPAGDQFIWSFGNRLDVAEGVCRGPWGEAVGDVVVSRTVIFVKPDYWVVRDVVLGRGDHGITACWQFFPGLLQADSPNSRVVCTDDSGSGLELIPLLGPERAELDVETGNAHPPRGWVSLNGSDHPASSCRYTTRSSLPVTLLWLLMPILGQDTSRVRATRHDRENGEIRVGIHFPGLHEDWFTFGEPDASNGEKQPLSYYWGSFWRVDLTRG